MEGQFRFMGKKATCVDCKSHRKRSKKRRYSSFPDALPALISKDRKETDLRVVRESRSRGVICIRKKCREHLEQNDTYCRGADLGVKVPVPADWFLCFKGLYLY